jgi:UDP-2-acetamido-3-amino-2,3-dideoxy-glucuronate N-acetyltransferase
MSALDLPHRALDPHWPSARGVDPLARIDGAVELPPDVVVRAGAYIPASVRIGAGCHIGPNAAFVEGDPIVVSRDVWIGANATLMPGITLAAKCVVRPGAVVGRSVPPGAIVEGNPAAIVGYVDTLRGPAAAVRHAPRLQASVEALPVDGVTVHQFPVVPDLRGNLTVGEFGPQVPFLPRRYFMVYGVPNREIRGEHAHRECHQFLICVQGSCAVVADDGRVRSEVTLDTPHRGLYLPPMTWGIQYKYTADAMLLVFASHAYDPADYIREYDEFLEHAARESM